MARSFHQSRLIVMLTLILYVQNEVFEADSVVLCELSPATFEYSRLPINGDYISDSGAHWQATLLKVIMIVNLGIRSRMKSVCTLGFTALVDRCSSHRSKPWAERIVEKNQ
jgi:hypothetical protein